MKAIFLLLTLTSSAVFAVENCVEFPVYTSPAVEYKGEITSSSSRLSFSDCPDSVLVNNDFVARLSRIVEHDNENKCVYSTRSVSFMCER